MSSPDIIAAHEVSIRHRPQVEASERCGCFYCGHVFAPGEIKDWIDDSKPGAPGETALCPQCGVDAG